jgi:xeroderma pigmentosum group C-complementing protein
VHVGTPPFGRQPSGSGSDDRDRDNMHCNRGGADDYDYAASDYDLWLDRDADLAVDAARAGNEARFINDYRGVPLPQPLPQLRSEGQGRGGGRPQRRRPNAEFRVVWDPRVGERCMAVFVLPAGKRAVGSARTVGIARGEEVLVSYGKGFWQGRKGEEEEGEEEGEDGERAEEGGPADVK